MKTTKAIVAALALSLIGTTTPIAAQVVGRDNADTVHFRNLCRQSAQTVRTGEPKARVSEALAQLRYCGADERPFLISYWQDGLRDPQLSDEARLERTSAILGVTDRRLFEGALNAVREQGLSLEQRTIAMVVVIAQLDPHMVFEVERLRTASPSHYCGGPRSATHIEVQRGEALPADAAAQVVAAMQDIVQSAGRTSPIGAAAACVRLTATVLAEPTTP